MCIRDREKRDRVRGALKQILGNLTDIGRKEKLVHILHEMGIYKIENCGTEFEIDSKTIGQIINLRNKCYHADRKNKEETKIDIDLAVTQLMYICLLYTSDAADEEDSVDLGRRRNLKKKK